jgi:dTMP kinase
MRPQFIVFEGLDGSGKSTQIQMLAAYYAAKGEPCLVTREPSDGNPVGQLTRQTMEHKHKLENETVAMLFAADRYQHVCGEILPALRGGSHVICDRYYYSNFAYQGNFARVFEYNRASMELLKPDVVFFLDVMPEECMRRINARDINTNAADSRTPKGRTGLYENINKLRSVRLGFFETFERLKAADRVTVIDASGLDAAQTFAEVLRNLR